MNRYNSYQRMHPHSCLLCKQRKVKCDRLDPKCSNCIKADVECTYRAPDPPRRRKRKASVHDVQAKLQYYEELLDQHGISTDEALDGSPSQLQKSPPVADSDRPTKSRTYATGQTIETNSMNSKPTPNRPYARSDLWDDIRAELDPQSRQVKTWLEEEEESVTDDDGQDESVSNQQHYNDAHLLLGSPSSLDIRDLLPPADHVRKLWLIYKENVDPVIKVIHVPTVDSIMSRGFQQLDSLSKSERALYASILTAAVNSINDLQCRKMFGQERLALLGTSRTAARQALGTANFLGTSSLTVLQAFLIFLVSVRQDYDHPSLWSLTGIAVRLGMRMGLNGKNVKRRGSPFEREIQKRVWLQLLIYDAQMGELAGCAPDWVGLVEGLQRPANLNDDDLHPDMTELPPEREDATDIIFTRMRYDLISTMRRMGLLDLAGPGSAQLTGKELQEVQEQAIKEMEDIFVNRYLRYCDPLVPLHKLVTLSGRGMIGRVKLYAGHPRQYADNGASLLQEDMDRLMDISLKVIEYHEAAATSKDLERFRWHVSLQIQYSALVFVLGQLRKRGLDSRVEKAWKLIEDLYEHHPELIKEGHRRFYGALGSLILGVWQHRNTEYERERGHALDPPAFIQRLRAQRDKLTKGKRSGKGAFEGSDTATSNTASTAQQTPFSDTQQSDFDSLDMLLPDLTGDWPPGFSTNQGSVYQAPLYWSEWDEMLRDFQRCIE